MEGGTRPTLREILQRWQRSTSGANNADADAKNDGGAAEGDAARPAAAPDEKLGLKVVVEEWAESDDERGVAGGCASPEAPADVPRGCCAVYVGAERRRFVVPTAYLGVPVFRRLLEKAEEEFGFDYHGGALTIPCETETFKYILLVMERHRNGLVDDEGNPTGLDGSL